TPQSVPAARLGYPAGSGPRALWAAAALSCSRCFTYPSPHFSSSSTDERIPPPGVLRSIGLRGREATRPPRHAASLAPDYRRGRALRLRAGGRPRRATAPRSRGAARGALRFSGPVLGRRPLALFALVRRRLWAKYCGVLSSLPALFLHWQERQVGVSPGRPLTISAIAIPTPPGARGRCRTITKGPATPPSATARWGAIPAATIIRPWASTPSLPTKGAAPTLQWGSRPSIRTLGTKIPTSESARY